MAGINDPVFRAICKRMGASLTYSEMISSKGLSYKNQKTYSMLKYLPEEAPFAVQLFGNEPQTMAHTAAELEMHLGNDLALIDINMGCPARKVAGKGDGAALMRTPELAAEIIAAVVTAVHVPVTVKCRKGFGSGEDTALELAKRSEQAGAAAIGIHGRTAHQLYQGTADRMLIERIAKAISIPVFASGDVYSYADIEDYFSRGAAGVFVARGALGNPWIFSQHSNAEKIHPRQKPTTECTIASCFLKPAAECTIASSSLKPTLDERIDIAYEHTTRLFELDPQKLVTMRRHIAWYFKGIPHATQVRNSLNECRTLNDYLQLLERIATWH